MSDTFALMEPAIAGSTPFPPPSWPPPDPDPDRAPALPPIDPRPWLRLPLRPCAECGRLVRQTRRRLCKTCHADAGLRLKYPMEAGAGTRAVVDRDCASAMPAEPTQHAPGSDAKIEIMAGRARRHELLCHPLDAPGDPEALALGVEDQAGGLRRLGRYEVEGEGD